jgi:3-carboxy-cis,cis-muconate cycloisomerase
VASAVQATGASLAALTALMSGLTVDTARMQANVVNTREVIFAEGAMTLLAPVLGRENAARAIDEALTVARRDNRAFGEVLALRSDVANALTGDDLAQLVSPEPLINAADFFRRRQLGG